MKRSKNILKFLINNLLVLSGTVMIFSGFVLQLGFHIGHANGHHGEKLHAQGRNIHQFREITLNKTVLGCDCTSWSAIHKVAIVLFSLFMAYHIIAHWKWYKCVFTKQLISKNKEVVFLSFLFLAVALTGFIPWFVDLLFASKNIRLPFIEIHDKLAIVLTIFLILHVTKRVKWFSNTFGILKNRSNI